VGLPNEAIEETEPAQGPVRNRFFECPSPADTIRPRTCLAESGQIGSRTNERDNAPGTCNTMKEHDGHHEDDSSPSLVTAGSTLIGSDPSSSDQELLVQEEATPDAIPAGWTRIKLEPDW
jgi:hypothetical protein